MFCTHCGKNLQDGTRFCVYCGKPQEEKGRAISYQAPQRAVGQAPVSGINNIFSALVREKTPGVIMEFSLWCVVCFSVVFSLVAAIVGEGNVTWILSMLFAIGLGVIMAFRLKPLALLYSTVCFDFLIPLIHYICFAKSGKFWGYEDLSYSALNIVLFILIILLSVGIVACAFVHFFSKVNLGNALTIMVITDTGLTILLQILMFAVGYIGDNDYMNDSLRVYLNAKGYWFGTISLWMIIVAMALFFAFFFWGFIDSSKGKLVGNTPVARGSNSNGLYPEMKGLNGVYAGRVFNLQHTTITIGSDPQMMLVIRDPYVSGKHCAIRFNSMTGFYEVYDGSRNGVMLSNGTRLQKGVYNSVQRGSVIYIGSAAQQFLLV